MNLASPIQLKIIFRENKMIDDEIIIVLQKFSKDNSLVYNQSPMPYRPCGEILGIIKDYVFKVYIYQSESSISSRLSTVFELQSTDLFPKGFCIEHLGDIYSKNESFDKKIHIRSYNTEIVKEYLNDKIKSILTDTFNYITELENSIFKIRSYIRLSDENISLTVGWISKDYDEFSKAYISVSQIFSSLIRNLKK